MSRVKTIKGLYVTRPKKYEVPKGFISFINKLKLRRPTELTEDDYSHLSNEVGSEK